MCTVTRPGVAPIAAASAVEMFVSILQHSSGYVHPSNVVDGISVNAPAERPSTNGASSTASSPLGPIPHQVRGSLSQWNNSLVEGAAYNKCTACSDIVSERNGTH